MGRKRRACAVQESALVIILLVLGYTSRLISEIREIVMNLLRNEQVRIEVHLGPNRMVPQQCTDRDTEVPYLAQLMWQEQTDQLLASHSRLLAYRRRHRLTDRHSQPVRETTNSRPVRSKCASADVATQTTSDEGTVVDTPPTCIVSKEKTAEGSGTTDIHAGQPAGDGEIPDTHPVSMAVSRYTDSGYGSEPSSSQRQNQLQGEDEKTGEACYIPGLSQPSASQGHHPTNDYEITSDPDIVDRNLPSQMEDPD